MKKVAWVLTIIGLFVLIFVVGGLVLPADYEYIVEQEIDASPQVVYEQLYDLKNWASWSAWSHVHHPGLQVEYVGEDRGKGAGQKFMHEKGTGKITITDVRPNERVELDMVFGASAPVHHDIQIAEHSQKTKVRWKINGTMDYGLASGWLAMITPRTFRNQVTVSLDNLKTELESDDDEPAGN